MYTKLNNLKLQIRPCVRCLKSYGAKPHKITWSNYGTSYEPLERVVTSSVMESEPQEGLGYTSRTQL